MPISWITAGLTFVGGVRLWSAPLGPPTISSFSASPSSLYKNGGTVTLSANVTSATSCTFTSNKSVAGLLTSTPCSNGNVSDTVTIPADTGKKAVTYKFTLAVTGTKLLRRRVQSRSRTLVTRRAHMAAICA